MTTPGHLRPARCAVVLAGLAVIGMMFAGCGQKGPLYLPGESPQQIEPGLPADAGDDAGTAGPEDEKEEDPAGER